MIQCNICSFKTDSEIKLSKHIQHIHKLKKTEYLIQTKYNGEHPLCACGCGQQTRYEASKLDFCKFIHGHQSRIEGHFGDPKAEKRVQAIIKTRKAKFAPVLYLHHSYLSSLIHYYISALFRLLHLLSCFRDNAHQ